jgi:mono/diheme cytochrome c family protein
MTSHALSLAVFLAAGLMLSHAQDEKQKSEIKHVPVSHTSAASGKEMFMQYCASCHGREGKGDGPAAAALNTPPPDLTALAKNNGGKYPTAEVASILHGERSVKAHGNREMPVWGPVFWRMSGGHESEVQQRVANLNDYLKSLQAQ